MYGKQTMTISIQRMKRKQHRVELSQKGKGEPKAKREKKNQEMATILRLHGCTMYQSR